MPQRSDTHRIMKNTLMLYIRMGFIMLVNLFLIRLVMCELGVEGFGIYNVIAGVVVLCSFLSNSMASATQRFFSFALGRRDPDLLAKTYSTNLLIYAAIALLAVLVLETAGLWFVSCRLKLPPGRLPEVLQLYQFSTFALVGLVFSAPFSAKFHIKNAPSSTLPLTLSQRWYNIRYKIYKVIVEIYKVV